MTAVVDMDAHAEEAFWANAAADRGMSLAEFDLRCGASQSNPYARVLIATFVNAARVMGSDLAESVMANAIRVYVKEMRGPG